MRGIVLECAGAGFSPPRTDAPKDTWLAHFCCIHKPRGLLSDPRLSTHHELATVASIHSRGQCILCFRSINAFSCPEAYLEAASPSAPSAWSALSPTHLSSLLTFKSI